MQRIWPTRFCRWHQMPGVDDARPKFCDRCKQPARRAGRIILHGHGSCKREVVVPPLWTGVPPGERCLSCWQRRYRCTACGHVMIVMPPGVMPRYLYSVAAIVLAWFLVTARPVGDHKSDAQAYQLQGIYGALPRYKEESKPKEGSEAGKQRERQEQPKADKQHQYKEERYRWRSLKRWLRAAPAWWPDWTGYDLSTLLAMFLQRAGGRGRQAAVAAAVAAHAQPCRGFAM